MEIFLNIKKSKKNKFGFTLIELLVVIAIIGILATVILISLNNARQKARIAKAQAEINQIVKAVILYKEKCGRVPPGRLAGFEASCPGQPTVTGGEDFCNDDGVVAGSSCEGAIGGDLGIWASGSGAAYALRGQGLIPLIETDPWGKIYCYCDHPSAGWHTAIYSTGPNGKFGTGGRPWIIGGPPGTQNFKAATCNTNPNSNDNCDNFGLLIPEE